MRFMMLLPLFVLNVASMELTHAKRDTCPQHSVCVTAATCEAKVRFLSSPETRRLTPCSVKGGDRYMEAAAVARAFAITKLALHGMRGLA